MRTRTCASCNAGAASAEAELTRWWAKEYTARFEAPGLRGSRAAGGVLLRSTVDGAFVLVVAGPATTGVRGVLSAAATTGEFTGTFVEHSGAWKVALLKSAYLAACVHSVRSRGRPTPYRLEPSSATVPSASTGPT